MSAATKKKVKRTRSVGFPKMPPRGPAARRLQGVAWRHRFLDLELKLRRARGDVVAKQRRRIAGHDG